MVTYLPYIGGTSLEAAGWGDRHPQQMVVNAHAWPAANRLLGYWFVPLQDYTAAGAWQVNAAASGNWCSSIIDGNFTRIATTGSFTQTAANDIQKIPFSGGNITLSAGNIYGFCTSSDGTGGEVLVMQVLTGVIGRAQGGIQMNGAGVPIPATVTPIAGVDTYYLPHGGVYHS